MKILTSPLILIALLSWQASAQDLNSILRDAQRLQKALERDAKQQAAKEKEAAARDARMRRRADADSARSQADSSAAPKAQDTALRNPPATAEKPVATAMPSANPAGELPSLGSGEAQRHPFDGANLFVDIDGQYADGYKPSWDLKFLRQRLKINLDKGSGYTRPFNLVIGPENGRSAISFYVNGVGHECVADLVSTSAPVLITRKPISLELTNFRSTSGGVPGCGRPNGPAHRWVGTATFVASPTGDVEFALRLDSYDARGQLSAFRLDSLPIPNGITPGQSVTDKAERLARDPDGERDSKVALAESRALMVQRYGEPAGLIGKRSPESELPKGANATQRHNQVQQLLWTLLDSVKPLQTETPVWKRAASKNIAPTCIYGDCENGYGISIRNEANPAYRIQTEGFFASGKLNGIAVKTNVNGGSIAAEHLDGRSTGAYLQKVDDLVTIANSEWVSGLPLSVILQHQEKAFQKFSKSNCFVDAQLNTSGFEAVKRQMCTVYRSDGEVIGCKNIDDIGWVASSTPGLKNICNVPVYVKAISRVQDSPDGSARYHDASVKAVPNETIRKIAFGKAYDSKAGGLQYLGEFAPRSTSKTSK